MTKSSLAVLFLLHILFSGFSQENPNLGNQKIKGYRGIWFELNQKSEYGDKYSGGLGTYTAKHMPLAIYAPEVDQTFFVYGGTTRENQKHLLCMAGVYDHRTGTVSKPTVVFDKLGVEDPHDNPSIAIDDKGFILVFVSGRNTRRAGIKLKSTRPYDISEFRIIGEEIFTYPQIWNTDKGFFHFFTKYTGVRELYFETSKDGDTWTADRKLAGIKEKPDQKSGHYQLSAQFENGSIIGTFFNRHRDGHPDTRTDLYYIQSRDHGLTWEDIHGHKSEIPLSEVDIEERVLDYQSQHKNVYMKDMGFDRLGNPVCLYLISGGHEPGPKNVPYQWYITSWTGKSWSTSQVCESDHNYDMGSLFISDTIWKIVGPTETGPQVYGCGGELAIWRSDNKGKDWYKEKDITRGSEFNHGYVRRVVNGRAPFCFFWANGNPEIFSKSELFFGNFKGEIWKLPYEMQEDFSKPLKMDF